MTGVLRSPAPIEFGTPIGPELFDVTTDVPGTFTYSPGPGTILGVGMHTLSVTFAPFDTTDYKTVTATTTITVLPATPTLRVAGGGVYDGSTHAAVAAVAGVDGTSGPALEGSAPVLTYYSGSTPSGPALDGPPSEVGTYTVVATFPGSADYAASVGPPVTFQVVPAPVAVALESSSGSAAFGQSIALTATVAAGQSGAGTPTGSVTFLDGGTPLGTVALDGFGRAVMAVNDLRPGGHAITAVYGGDADRSGAHSAAVAESIGPVGTRITLVPHAVLKGKRVAAVTFTAVIEPLVPGAGVATGVITFWAKKKILRAVALVDGQAMLSLKPGAALNKPITVAYGGGAGLLASMITAPSLTTKSLRAAARSSARPWSG